jgi:hypothetical protein
MLLSDCLRVCATLSVLRRPCEREAEFSAGRPAVAAELIDVVARARGSAAALRESAAVLSGAAAAPRGDTATRRGVDRVSPVPREALISGRFARRVTLISDSLRLTDRRRGFVPAGLATRATGLRA